ncbi:hypothetical protein ABZ723_06330 [Streptomyces sp. NPDC006700]|uniref:hypothetical protein n=1 Tax=Streptomyces sp. NPDC006700 TaxID=3154479 RepID=UPI0033FBB85E
MAAWFRPKRTGRGQDAVTAEKPGKRGNTGGGERRADRPETAAGEALREFEDAERDVTGAAGRRHRGEAGDATTPNTRAEEESEGD